jgi:lysophospholipase L1-like esterase
MRSLILAIALLISSAAWSQVVLQALPPDTPQNCHTRSDKMYQWLQDWPNLSRYRQADAELAAPNAGEKRVVFMGDSITDSWKLENYFPGKPYVNRGISAQTTPQMLLRFHQDVIALHPRVVVILAGTNDIAGNTGPLSLEEIESNYASMADLARANHIAVVFSSITPVSDYTERSHRFFAERPIEKIQQLNVWLKDYARGHGEIYLDYYSHMLDEKGLLRRDLAEDGLHPNDSGYRIMAALAEKAIAEAMRKKR